ncbi:MAG: hypothetical protein PWQ15_123 [Methanobacterium sp.]|nr:hypothetical protein [Methanobacterium sp.]
MCVDNTFDRFNIYNFPKKLYRNFYIIKCTYYTLKTAFLKKKLITIRPYKIKKNVFTTFQFK